MKLIIITLLLLSTQVFSAEYKVDAVRVYKSKHKMEMLFKGEVTKVYSVMLGRGGMGPKRQKGDLKVPEGKYFLDYKNPNSSFYRSIHISYPNRSDIDRAAQLGLNPGGDIFIHGMPNYFPEFPIAMEDSLKELLLGFSDWTAGCVAVLNYEMKEIWENVKVESGRIPITIYP